MSRSKIKDAYPGYKKESLTENFCVAPNPSKRKQYQYD